MIKSHSLVSAKKEQDGGTKSLLEVLAMQLLSSLSIGWPASLILVKESSLTGLNYTESQIGRLFRKVNKNAEKTPNALKSGMMKPIDRWLCIPFTNTCGGVASLTTPSSTDITSLPRSSYLLPF